MAGAEGLRTDTSDGFLVAPQLTWGEKGWQWGGGPTFLPLFQTWQGAEFFVCFLSDMLTTTDESRDM